MARMVTFLKEYNGRHVGDGVYFDEAEAYSLIEKGIAMDAIKWRKMQAEKKAEPVKPLKQKAPDKPKKDRMVRAPVKKK